MSLILQKSKSFQVPPGVHRACCTGIYDLGTQPNEKFGKPSRRVLFTWEIPDARLTDGRSATISREYTNSGHEKATLRRDIEVWTGKRIAEDGNFDLDSLLGEGCYVQVMNYDSNGTVRSKVNAVMPLPKGMSVLPEGLLRFFSIEDGIDIPEGTPEWIVKKIQASPEYQQRMKEQSAAGKGSGPIPAECSVDEPF